MDKKAKIYLAGHRGLVGSAIMRKLQERGFNHIVCRTHAELDLLDQRATADFFALEKPEYVMLAAAKVGGILANDTYPADYIYLNLQIQNNIIHQSYLNGVKKLLFLGSSCIYPRDCPQPIKEEYLLTGPLEKTNEAYAIAKIAGLKMCEYYHKQYGCTFISVMPTNIYGPGDNFNLETSHMIPALIRKFHEAKMLGKKEVVLWGTGSPRREPLFVDDMADACVFLMQHYDSPELINIGTGEEYTIKQYAEIIGRVVGFQGEVMWDPSKPDGTPRKINDSLKLRALGWKPKYTFEEGAEKTYKWFLQNYKSLKSK